MSLGIAVWQTAVHRAAGAAHHVASCSMRVVLEADMTFAAGGSSSLHSPCRGVEVHSPSRGIGAGMLSKVSNSMDRAKMMGSRVVPTFHKDRKAQARLHSPCSSEGSSHTNMFCVSCDADTGTSFLKWHWSAHSEVNLLS